MKERPILFSSPMVRALLAGRKTQTRRVIKPQPEVDRCAGQVLLRPPGGKVGGFFAPHVYTAATPCPAGAPGDRLWVREKWACLQPSERTPVIYGASRGQRDYRWRPSIHMPRWASRITLEVTGVRVERLQEISDEDARAEGVAPHSKSAWDPYRLGFATLWDSINGKRAPWSSNPWVWVVAFKRLDVP